MTELPRAGETWERVRDGRRVEVDSVGRIGVGLTLSDGPESSYALLRRETFRSQFRRVSDGRET
jgi:hypothetical protein